MRGVGYELALAGERLREPVEHVVERLREDADLVPAALRRGHAWLQIASVDTGRHSRHPAEGRGHTRAREIRRDQGERERERAGHDERLGDAALRLIDGRQRLTGADGYVEPAQPDGLLVDA
jgi:hypothetical protein